MKRASVVRVCVGWGGLCGLLAIVPAIAIAERQAPPPARTGAPAMDAKPSSSLDALAWMTGDWTGSMGKAAIEEHWIPAAGKLMLGVSRTVVGDRAVAFEFLRLEQRADGVVYIAQPGGRPPTEFRLTKAGASAATFENPQHDNPKIIRYWKDGDATLVAEIEGDEKGKPVKQRFTFTRAARP